MGNSQRPGAVQPLQTAAEEAPTGVPKADLQVWTGWIATILARLDALRDMRLALAPLDRDSREQALVELLAQERAGPPVPPFTDVMAEADYWADMASLGELWAYCIACYSRLSPGDQRAFRDHLRETAAA